LCGGELARVDELLHDVLEGLLHLLGDGIVPRHGLFYADAGASLIVAVVQAIEGDVWVLFLQVGDTPLEKRIAIDVKMVAHGAVGPDESVYHVCETRLWVVVYKNNTGFETTVLNHFQASFK